MRPISQLMIVSIATLALACKGKQSDNGLNDDLNQAGQTTAQQDSISAAERTGSTSKPVYHTHHYHSYSSSTSSAPAPAPQPTYRTQHNGGRDAAIGAGAGAVLGAVTSHDKLKGGVVGAALGGIAGAVIGNNVDTKKVPNN